MKPKAWIYSMKLKWAVFNPSNLVLQIRANVNWWELTAYGLILAAAAVMRLWDLGSRALHHDESLHAFYSWNLFNGNGYIHDPMMHGPLQFEATAALFFILGDSDVTSRLIYAFLGIVLVGMPFFLRNRLGNIGSLFAAGMLAFSPTMLYFSRFSRNDILMAVWTLGLVITMWRYWEEGKNRYLYISAVFLALAFATKETAFMTVLILALFIVFQISIRTLVVLQQNIKIGEISPPAALGRWVKGMWEASRVRIEPSLVSRPTAFLIVLITLTLPQWSAAVGVFQNVPPLRWTNLIFINPVSQAPVGAPAGGAMTIAFVVVIILLVCSIYIGMKWKWSTWWRSALIFYLIWILLYSTFFTNINGIGSGVWQSLGYWIVQQGEARGGQPIHYYLILISIYEFLPGLLALISIIYYSRRKDVFNKFLVYWAVATFIMYAIASEKMPWLLVNITLPLTILAGKFLGDLVQTLDWRRLKNGGGLFIIAVIPLGIVLLWQLAFYELGTATGLNLIDLILLIIGLLILLILGYYLAKRSGTRNFAAFGVLVIATILLMFTVKTGLVANYKNGDVPVEMLVYTQTSPDIVRLSKSISQTANATGHGRAIPIMVDQTSGFSWPWAWYLRHYTRVAFPSLENAPLKDPGDALVLLVHRQNQEKAKEILREPYGKAHRVRHRWWFPENTYKNLTLGEFVRSFKDRSAWRRAMNYFLYREGVREHIGSEDAYLYISPDFPLKFRESD